MKDVANSYRLCQQFARRAASNFYYAFLLLPHDKRRAMCALYAFLRHVDDVGDADGQSILQRREQLIRLRRGLSAALAGSPTGPILPAVADTVVRFAIPADHLAAVLDGVEMDLDARRYETWSDLQGYCDCVASAVGYCCLHIWGYSGEQAMPSARACGHAFQLTNILRDLREDAERNRIYLPTEDLRRFGYSADDLRHQVRNKRFTALMQFEIARAESLYAEAGTLLSHLSREGRRIFRVMLATYRALLAEIKRRDGDVFGRRIGLSAWQKVQIVTKCGLSGALAQ
jgi:phytoene synthase